MSRNRRRSGAPNPEHLLRLAYQHYRDGDFAAARDALRSVHAQPKARQLLGMIERRNGDLNAALEHFRAAADGAPNDAEVFTHLGWLQRDRGDLDAAEAAFRSAQRLSDGNQSAAMGLARVLLDSGQLDAAAALYGEWVERAPAERVPRFGLASTHLELGAVEQALAGFDALIAGAEADSSAVDAELYFMRGRTRMQLGDLHGARLDLSAAFAARKTPLYLRTLAKLLWMSGATDDFRELVERAVQVPGLGIAAVNLARESEALEWAVALHGQVAEAERNQVEYAAVAAWIAIRANDPSTARPWCDRALELAPGDASALEAQLSTLLMEGEAAAALELAQRCRDNAPDVQSWIGYAETARRLLGMNTAAWTTDLVRSYTLPVPEGFASLAEFNRAFIELLGGQNALRERPLDQSLRQGVQTPRNLATLEHPLLKAYHAALRGPIDDYLKRLGSDPRHPCARRNSGNYAIHDCWSVALAPGGHHVNHLHPNGWISSAYYVQVPDSVDAASKAGWIKFGEPPVLTRPALGPEKWVRPEPGMVVLFPSYVWHGTAPSPEGAPRITAPFDVRPL